MKKIVLIFRLPVGGLFRHVYDLGIALAKRGYDIGVVCSDEPLPPRWQQMLDELAGFSTLGVLRTPIMRGPGLSDLSAMAPVVRYLKQVQPDIVHGHGAKGGLYARICATIAGGGMARVYTTHGGSLQYPVHTLEGQVYTNTEKLLLHVTDGLAFESTYIKRTFEKKVAVPKCALRVVYNGLEPFEFELLDRAQAHYDFLYMAEFVLRKGYDQYVQALASLKQQGLSFKALCAGSGPEEDNFRGMVADAGLEDCVDFSAPMAARDLFKKSKVMVIPSRAESMPYAIIEAAAAQIPIISTQVGGIPEILAQDKTGLYEADNLDSLIQHMRQFLKTPAIYEHSAKMNRNYVLAHFHIDRMVDGILELYESALTRRRR